MAKQLRQTPTGWEVVEEFPNPDGYSTSAPVTHVLLALTQAEVDAFVASAVPPKSAKASSGGTS